MTESRKTQLLKLLENEPHDPFLLFAIAKEYEYEENWSLAKNTYLRLHKINPDYLAFYYHYGKLCEHLSDRELAKEFYQKGIVKCLEYNDLHSKSELETALMNLQIEEL